MVLRLVLGCQNEVRGDFKLFFFYHLIKVLCWLSRSPSSPIRSRTAEEACCSKAVASPPRLNLKPTAEQGVGIHFDCLLRVPVG